MDKFITLNLLLVLCACVKSFIIPEEVPTVLSLIYSNIPPIKKGTDSRIGIGFRLGEHADFQTLIELGPQTETDPIGGDSNSKRRRDAMFGAAMRGELGPWAQAVVRYQLKRRLQKELEAISKEKGGKVSLKVTGENSKYTPGNEKTNASEWLEKWREGVLQTKGDAQ